MLLWAVSPISTMWYCGPWVPSLPCGIVGRESHLYHVVLWAVSPISTMWYCGPWVPSLPCGMVGLESHLYTWHRGPWVPSVACEIASLVSVFLSCISVSLESHLYHAVLWALSPVSTIWHCKDFTLFQESPERFWSPPSLLLNGYRGLLSEGKAVGAWRRKSTPHKAPRLEKEYSFTFSCQRITVKQRN